MIRSVTAQRIPNRKILLVDREHDVQGPLIVKLRAAGFQTLAARSGKDALAIAEHEALTMIIIDPRLQDMSGAKLGATVRERNGTPFLFLTERDTSQYESAALEAGAMTILSKKTHPVDLVTQIQMAIRQADAIASAQQQNQDLHRRVNHKINQEVFIGCLMEQWQQPRKTVRRTLNQFARARRMSLDELADIHASHRDTVTRLNNEYARRIAEIQPDILVELNMFQSREISGFGDKPRANEA